MAAVGSCPQPACRSERNQLMPSHGDTRCLAPAMEAKETRSISALRSTLAFLAGAARSVRRAIRLPTVGLIESGGPLRASGASSRATAYQRLPERKPSPERARDGG